MRFILLVVMIALSLLAHAQANDNPTYTISKTGLSACLEKSHFAAMTLEMRLRGETLAEAAEMVNKLASSPKRRTVFMEITREMHRVDLPDGGPAGRPFINGIFNHQVTRCIAGQ